MLVRHKAPDDPQRIGPQRLEALSMSQLLFIVVSLALIFALAMRQAPLWMWAAGVAAITFGWQSGIATGNAGSAFTGWSLLAWLPAIVLAVLSVPGFCRAVLVLPSFGMTREILARISHAAH